METVVSTIQLKWIDGTLMTAVDSGGRPLVMGSYASDIHEWRGLKGSDLLLVSAAACSTYDVITILQKQREPVEKLDVVCTGEQRRDPPYKFEKIHLHYIIKGNVDADKAAKAIQLSEEKYCSVVATLREAVEFTSDFEINP
jgi:putative redox protein